MLYKYYQSTGDKHTARKINSDRKAAALIEEHLEKEKRDREEQLRIYRSHHPEEFEDEPEDGESEDPETEEGEMESSEEEAQSTEGEETEDGEDSSDFTPGLPVQMLDPDEVMQRAPDPDSGNSAAVEQARAMAQSILAEAQQEAESLVEAARQEADGIREQARQSGYQEGRQSGEEEMNRVLEEKQAELVAEEEALKQRYEDTIKELEPEMLDTMLEIFNRVFHIQFDDKKEILSYLVKKTIMNVEGSKEFRIRASQDNYPYLSAHLEEIRKEVGEEYVLEVISDNLLAENECVIETDGGYFDCSLGVHLESLIKDLKSICLTST